MSADLRTTATYRLRSNDRYGWKTGKDENGRPLLVAETEERLLCLRFDAEGNLTDVFLEEKGFDGHAEETFIRIREFEIPEHGIALRVLPSDFQEFVDNPWSYGDEERSHLAVMVNQWRERDCFAFVWRGEHRCFGDGLVHT